MLHVIRTDRGGLVYWTEPTLFPPGGTGKRASIRLKVRWSTGWDNALRRGGMNGAPDLEGVEPCRLPEPVPVCEVSGEPDPEVAPHPDSRDAIIARWSTKSKKPPMVKSQAVETYQPL
jgi:hypothetical protein